MSDVKSKPQPAKAFERQRAKRGQPKPYLRADGRWAVTLELRSEEVGRRVRRHIYGRSAEEVRDRAKAARSSAQAGDARFSPATSLAEWTSYWIGSIAPKWDESGRRTGMKHSSWRGYEKHVRLNIVPLAIGKTPLDRLTRPMVKAWMAYLAGEDPGALGGRDGAARARPLGPRSIKYALDTLRVALAEAKERDLVAVNVAQDLKAPSQTSAEATIFTLEEARIFLRAIRGHGDEALLLVSVFAGPRQGETLSLKWEDLDLEKGVVTFKHTLDWIDGRPVAEENKNSSSRRSVHLPPYVMNVLRRHAADQRALIAGRGRSDGPEIGTGNTRRYEASAIADYGLVFIGERGQPLRGATVYRRFHRLLKAHGLPLIRWHDLRHSAASIMLALGLPLFAVQKTIGHANLQMLSQRYGHVVPELAAAEVAKLEGALLQFDAGSD